MHIDLPVDRWAFWAEGLPATAPTDARGEPDVSFVEPLLRRRLSRLARMALCVAHACRQGEAAVRFVFASRHGDLNRTHRLLVDLAGGEPLSPTAFGLSVLNAVPGLLGILNADHSAATAVSAGEDSLAQGLIEAAGQLAEDPQAPVLLVLADEPVPECYRAYLGGGRGGLPGRGDAVSGSHVPPPLPNPLPRGGEGASERCARQRHINEPPAHALGLLLRAGGTACRLERGAGPDADLFPAAALARALRDRSSTHWPGWTFRHV